MGGGDAAHTTASFLTQKMKGGAVIMNNDSVLVGSRLKAGG